MWRGGAPDKEPEGSRRGMGGRQDGGVAAAKTAGAHLLPGEAAALLAVVSVAGGCRRCRALGHWRAPLAAATPVSATSRDPPVLNSRPVESALDHPGQQAPGQLGPASSQTCTESPEACTGHTLALRFAACTPASRDADITPQRLAVQRRTHPIQSCLCSLRACRPPGYTLTQQGWPPKAPA